MQPIDINSPLKLEYLHTVLHYDPSSGIWTWKVGPSNAIKAGSRAGKIVGSGHRQIVLRGWLYYSARLAVFYMTGEWPKDRVDHRNRIRDDDRWENLREASESDNGANRSMQINNTSGYRGVSWDMNSSKWEVRVNRVYLGRYDDLDIAILIRAEFADKYQGEFAVPNS